MRYAFNPPSPNTHLGSIASNKSRCVTRGILLWALGIPIPSIIILYLFHVI